MQHFFSRYIHIMRTYSGVILFAILFFVALDIIRDDFDVRGFVVRTLALIFLLPLVGMLGPKQRKQEKQTTTPNKNEHKKQ